MHIPRCNWLKVSTLLIIGFILSSNNKSFCQINEFSTWYFGHNAGLTWKDLQPNGDPSPLFDGQINTMEAVATISDSYGNLLFYTDGSTVFNREHLPMGNSLASSLGGKLKGHFSSSTIAVVPNPIYSNIYYIFTVAAQLNSDGLCYSKLDMNLDNGLGDIDLSEKNISIFSPTTEKVLAIKHENNIDIWIITHPWNTNQFYSYLITGNGVNLTNPVISTVGSIHTGPNSNTIGLLRSSNSGTKIACSIFDYSLIEYFDFDKNTGIISNCISLPTGIPNNCYAIAFSPNENFIYATSDAVTGSIQGGLFQFDISYTNITDIVASKTIISSIDGGYGQIQLGNDNKLYVSRYGSDYISRINSPDSVGIACDFENESIFLSLGSITINCAYGLPSIINSSFSNPKKINYTACSSTTLFEILDTSNIDQAYWNFNYPSTDTLYHYTDSGYTASFQYDSPGTYYVELKVNRYGYIDSSLHQIFIEFPLDLDLGQDTVLCTDESILYELSYLDSSAYSLAANYSWHAMIENHDYYSSNSTYSINKPGLYSVTVSGSGICPDVSDQILVQYNNVVADFGSDSLGNLCISSPVTLDVSYLNSTYGLVSYLWNTQQTTSSISALVSGTYSVTVSSGYCQSSESIELEYDNPLITPFSTNFFLCEDSSITLNALNEGSDYLWSNFGQSQEIVVSLSGQYSVTISNACGSIIDTANVLLIPASQDLLGDTSYNCYNSNLILSAYSANPFQQYLWSTNESAGAISVINNGLYTVTVSSQCGSFIDSTQVINHFPLFDLLGNDTLVCPGFELMSTESGDSYYWLSGETSQSITISHPGIYYLEIANSCGVFWDEIQIGILDYDFEIELGTDTTICLGDTLILSTNFLFDHLWNDLTTCTELAVYETGTYQVTVSNVCYAHSDSIHVSFVFNDFTFEIDSLFIQEGQSEILEVSPGYYSYLWSNGQTDHWISIDTEGMYWLETVDNSGCAAIDSIIVIQLSNLTTVAFNQIIVYPNPSNNTDLLQICNLPQSSTIQIFTQKGQLIRTIQVNQSEMTLHLNDLSNGIYYLLFQSPRGRSLVQIERL